MYTVLQSIIFHFYIGLLQYINILANRLWCIEVNLIKWKVYWQDWEGRGHSCFIQIDYLYMRETIK